LIYSDQSGLVVGDTRRIPSIITGIPDLAEIRAAKDSMIISASGWRKVFAASGDEEDVSEDVSPRDLILAGIAGLSFGDFLLQSLSKAPEDTVVVVACDSRPTGTLLGRCSDSGPAEPGFYRPVSFHRRGPGGHGIFPA
jgi:phosphoglucomutase